MPKSIFYIIFLILVINNVIISGWVVPTLNPHHPKKTDLVKNLLTYLFWILSIYIPLQRPSVQIHLNFYFLMFNGSKLLKDILHIATELYSQFFWDQSQDMSSSSFPPKNRPLIGRPDRSANQRIVFLAGNHLNSCPDSDLRKNWL